MAPTQPKCFNMQHFEVINDMLDSGKPSLADTAFSWLPNMYESTSEDELYMLYMDDEKVIGYALYTMDRMREFISPTTVYDHIQYMPRIRALLEKVICMAHHSKAITTCSAMKRGLRVIERKNNENNIS